MPGHRCRVYDRATTLLRHMRDLVLHAKPDALQIHRDRPVPIVFGQCRDASTRAFNPGIIMREVERAVQINCAPDEHCHFGPNRNVCANKRRIAARSLDSRDRFFAAGRIDIRHNNFCTGICKSDRRSLSNSRRASSHQRNFALEFLRIHFRRSSIIGMPYRERRVSCGSS